MTFSVSLILSDRSTSMLKSFLVVSVLKMEVYEFAISVAIHHEEHRAKLASYSGLHPENVSRGGGHTPTFQDLGGAAM